MKQIIVTTHEELRELFHESIQKFKEGLEAEPQHQAPSDPIFTMDEATAYLKLSKSTLYGYTSKSIIPHFKQGKRVLFRKSHLDHWLDLKQLGNTTTP